MNGNVKEGKWKIGIAFLLAVLVPVPMVGAQAGIEGLKGIDLFMLIGYEGMNAFTVLSRITLALSFLVAITGFAYFIHKRRKKEARRGMKLTSISDVFLVSVQILSEIRVVGYRMEGLKGRIEGLEKGIKKEMGDARALILFGIATILAISLTIYINTVMNISHSSYHKQVGAHSGIYI